MTSHPITREAAMIDVARLAGVSHQTVSRVINQHPSVSPQTRDRVNAAIAQLRYRPNRAAKTLVTGRSQAIGVVAQNSTLYGPASVLAAFEQQAAAAGFAVSVSSVASLDSQSLIDAVDRHLDQRVAGIVVIAPVTSASEAIAGIPRHVALVAIDGNPEHSTSLVTVDQQAGATLATQCLLDAGHQTVWHVAGPVDWFDSTGRIQGWENTLTAAGAQVPPLIRGGWSAASGYRAGQMLARMSQVTAIFTANDHLALGVLRALHEGGRQVPQDVSVVGFDDVPEAAYFIPPLTTIKPDFAEVARRTLDVLQQRMDPAHDAPFREIIVPTLVRRASVGPPPRRPGRRTALRPS